MSKPLPFSAMRKLADVRRLNKAVPKGSTRTPGGEAGVRTVVQTDTQIRERGSPFPQGQRGTRAQVNRAQSAQVSDKFNIRTPGMGARMTRRRSVDRDAFEPSTKDRDPRRTVGPGKASLSKKQRKAVAEVKALYAAMTGKREPMHAKQPPLSTASTTPTPSPQRPTNIAGQGGGVVKRGQVNVGGNQVNATSRTSAAGGGAGNVKRGQTWSQSFTQRNRAVTQALRRSMTVVDADPDALRDAMSKAAKGSARGGKYVRRTWDAKKNKGKGGWRHHYKHEGKHNAAKHAKRKAKPEEQLSLFGAPAEPEEEHERETDEDRAEQARRARGKASVAATEGDKRQHEVAAAGIMAAVEAKLAAGKAVREAKAAAALAATAAKEAAEAALEAERLHAEERAFEEERYAAAEGRRSAPASERSLQGPDSLDDDDAGYVPPSHKQMLAMAQLGAKLAHKEANPVERARAADRALSELRRLAGVSALDEGPIVAAFNHAFDGETKAKLAAELAAMPDETIKRFASMHVGQPVVIAGKSRKVKSVGGATRSISASDTGMSTITVHFEDGSWASLRHNSRELRWGPDAESAGKPVEIYIPPRAKATPEKKASTRVQKILGEAKAAAGQDKLGADADDTGAAPATAPKAGAHSQAELEGAGGNFWEKHGKRRMYFNAKTHGHKRIKVWYDLNSNEWGTRGAEKAGADHDAVVRQMEAHVVEHKGGTVDLDAPEPTLTVGGGKKETGEGLAPKHWEPGHTPSGFPLHESMATPWTVPPEGGRKVTATTKTGEKVTAEALAGGWSIDIGEHHLNAKNGSWSGLEGRVENHLDWLSRQKPTKSGDAQITEARAKAEREGTQAVFNEWLKTFAPGKVSEYGFDRMPEDTSRRGQRERAIDERAKRPAASAMIDQLKQEGARPGDMKTQKRLSRMGYTHQEIQEINAGVIGTSKVEPGGGDGDAKADAPSGLERAAELMREQAHQRAQAADPVAIEAQVRRDVLALFEKRAAARGKVFDAATDWGYERAVRHEMGKRAVYHLGKQIKVDGTAYRITRVDDSGTRNRRIAIELVKQGRAKYTTHELLVWPSGQTDKWVPGKGSSRPSATQLIEGEGVTYAQQEHELVARNAEQKVLDAERRAKRDEAAKVADYEAKEAKKRAKAEAKAKKAEERAVARAEEAEQARQKAELAHGGGDIPPEGTPRADAIEATATQRAAERDEMGARTSRYMPKGKQSTSKKTEALWRNHDLNSAVESVDADILFTRKMLAKENPGYTLARVADDGIHPALGLLLHFSDKKFPPAAASTKRGSTWRMRPGSNRTETVNRHGYEQQMRMSISDQDMMRGYHKAYQIVRQTFDYTIPHNYGERVWDSDNLMATQTAITELLRSAMPGGSNEVTGGESYLAQEKRTQSLDDVDVAARAYLVKMIDDIGPPSMFERVPKSHPTAKLAEFQGKIRTVRETSPDVDMKPYVEEIIGGASMNKAFNTVSKREGYAVNLRDVYDTAVMRRKGPESRVQGDDAFAKGDHAEKVLDGWIADGTIKSTNHGNYVTDEERAHHLKSYVDSMDDLMGVLGLPTKMAGYNGKLTIGFGAYGEAGALAHYEHGRKIINLTRNNGAGSLAHEWGHFLDFVAGDVGEGEGPLSSGQGGGPARDDAQGLMQSDAMSGYRARLKKVVEDNPLMNASQRGYWQSRTEVWARCFERHVQRKLHKAGRENTYLVAVRKSHSSEDGLWPTDAEVDALAPLFDRFFETFAKSDLLHKMLRAQGEQVRKANRHRIVDAVGTLAHLRTKRTA